MENPEQTEIQPDTIAAAIRDGELVDIDAMTTPSQNTGRQLREFAGLERPVVMSADLYNAILESLPSPYELDSTLWDVFLKYSESRKRDVDAFTLEDAMFKVHLQDEGATGIEGFVTVNEDWHDIILFKLAGTA